MPDQRGLALIDILVAAALSTVVAATAMPVIGGALERERTTIGARYVTGVMYRARLEALKRACAVAVRIENVDGRTTLQVFADGNGNGVLQRDIDREIDLPLTPIEHLDVRARDVALRINQSIVDAAGAATLAPGDDPIRIGSSSLVSFSALGSATAGTLYVAASRGPQLAIRIFGPTGRIRLLIFDPRARTWRT